MRYMRIENNIAVNAEEWTETPDIDGVTYVASDTAHIGATLNEDGTFTNPTPQPVIPQVVSRMQALMALANAGLYDTVNNYMTGSTVPLVDKIYWSESSDFHRDHSALISMAGALGLTSDQLDQLFIAASLIT